MPRTTLALDDEVFAIAKQYADSRSISLGRAVSDLIRRGLKARSAGREANGLIIFDLPVDSPKVTPDRVRRLEVDEP